MINVVTTITALPGRREVLLEMLQGNMPAVHAEAGCVAYQPYVDAGDLGGLQTKIGEEAFMVLEIWASIDALKAHGAAPHMVEFLGRARPMMTNLVVNILSPV